MDRSVAYIIFIYLFIIYLLQSMFKRPKETYVLWYMFSLCALRYMIFQQTGPQEGQFLSSDV